MPFGQKPPYPRLRLDLQRRRGFSSKPKCPFLPNHDKLGPLPLPNGDSIEPRDSSSELAAYGDLQPPWTLNTRILTAFLVTGSFFTALQKSKIERQAEPDPVLWMP